MPNALFQKYIKIVLADTNEYQPYIPNSELPEELRQLRKPWEHCRAMGSQVGIDEDCYLA